MKRSKIPQDLAKNASKQHKLVGQLLTCNESPYKGYQIRQEYRVSEVNPDYKSNREKFDWVILGLQVVIEVHGEQHYQPVCFGGMDLELAKYNFRRQRRVDQEKRAAAEAAGWAYIVVKYDEKVTVGVLEERIGEALRALPEGARSPSNIPKKYVVKIPHPKEYKWPTRKIPSRPFPKRK